MKIDGVENRHYLDNFFINVGLHRYFCKECSVVEFGHKNVIAL